MEVRGLESGGPNNDVSRSCSCDRVPFIQVHKTFKVKCKIYSYPVIYAFTYSTEFYLPALLSDEYLINIQKLIFNNGWGKNCGHSSNQ